MPRGPSHDYLVYLIYSCTTNRVYVGISNNFAQRLHNHNNTRAGARYTKCGRPWTMALQICGFADRTTAEQFEWALQHPGRTRHLKAQRAAKKVNGSRSFSNWYSAALLLCQSEFWRGKFSHVHCEYIPARLQGRLLELHREYKSESQ